MLFSAPATAFPAAQPAAPAISDKFPIQDYLERLNSNSGRCKICRHRVPWQRVRVISHKTSGNCVGISSDERARFQQLHQLSRDAKRVAVVAVKRTAESADLARASLQALPFKRPRQFSAANVNARMELTPDNIEHANKLLAEMIFRTGMPIRAIDSPSWKQFVRCLNPAYAEIMPDATTLVRKYLTKEQRAIVLARKDWRRTGQCNDPFCPNCSRE